jgi:hypothetical protein
MRAAFLLALTACNSGLSPANGGLPSGADQSPVETGAAPLDTGTGPIDGNGAPFADAGPDQQVTISQVIALDGSGSSDPDGDPLTFAWELIAIPTGSGTTLLDETESNPEFFADRPGTYTLLLTVDDGALVATDEVDVLAEAPNDDPVANAGPDQTVDVGDTVQLNGSSSFDPNNDPLSYHWTLTLVPAGSTAALVGDTTALPQFAADKAGSYVIELVVADGSAGSGPDTVTIDARTPSSSGGGCSCPPPPLVRERLHLGDVAGSAGLLLLPLAFARARRR